MTIKVIELSIDELKKLDSILESYASQQLEQRLIFGECDEDKIDDPSFFDLRIKIKTALRSKDRVTDEQFMHAISNPIIE